MLNGNSPHYLDPTHPNYERWKKSREISYERGRFVKFIISKYKPIRNIKILDVGSGFGGTIQNFFDESNLIYSVEIDEYKLNTQPEHQLIKKYCCDAFHLPFSEKFDVIILQDFIEHIEDPSQYLAYISNLLKQDGIIYISTPNKFSLLNLISDPHWGFPFVSILSRRMIKKIFLPIFRKREKERKDIAQLLSLDELIKLFRQNNFKFYLHTIDAVKTLFENPQQIIWSSFHISLVRFIKKLKLDKLLIIMANDKIGFVNKFFTPTFYFILKRE